MTNEEAIIIELQSKLDRLLAIVPLGMSGLIEAGLLSREDAPAFAKAVVDAYALLERLSVEAPPAAEAQP